MKKRDHEQEVAGFLLLLEYITRDNKEYFLNWQLTEIERIIKKYNINIPEIEEAIKNR